MSFIPLRSYSRVCCSPKRVNFGLMIKWFGPVRVEYNRIDPGRGHKSDYFRVRSRSGQKITGHYGVEVLKTLPHRSHFSPSISYVHCGALRVRVVFHKTVRVFHVYCNFWIGLTCRITVIFGTLKDGRLLINTLASNICFSYRNMFQNGVDALSKIVDAFLSKSSTFYPVRIIR